MNPSVGDGFGAESGSRSPAAGYAGVRRKEGMRVISRAGMLGVLFITLVPSVDLADHCPDEALADGVSEHVLAGIDLVNGKLEQVQAIFGAPSDSQEGTGPDYPEGSGYVAYEWKATGTVLSLDTEFYHDEGGRRVESLVAAKITGTPSSRRLGTGRGLRLGDTWKRAQRLYGHRFVDGTVNGPRLGTKTITYCFSDDTELEVGLDADGRVVGLRLAPSVK